MYKYLLVISSSLFLLACGHESLEDRASREASEFTKKYCPTPIANNTRTDSVVFYKSTRTYTYYCSFSGMFDNSRIINKVHAKIREGLSKGIIDNTNLKVYKEAGFNFEYVCHSTQSPKKVLFRAIFTKKDYQQPLLLRNILLPPSSYVTKQLGNY